MKLLILVLSILTISIFSFANNHEEGKSKGKMDIEARKAKVTANIDKRIATLNTLKACVAKAKAKGDMKACRQAHKESMKALKMEKKEH